MNTDRLSSALLDFGAGHAMFTCSTQLVPFQRMQILGTCFARGANGALGSGLV
jgi:hypothetical protein